MAAAQSPRKMKTTTVTSKTQKVLQIAHQMNKK
jgi:hypothetical protein